MKRTKKEQKARSKKYGEKSKNCGNLSVTKLGMMSASMLSSFIDKFGK